MEPINESTENIEYFFDFVEKNICPLTQTQKKQYNEYYISLIYNNLRFNLFSRKEQNIIDRHFINSVLLALLMKFNSSDNILDIGTGGGFPGIILKILFPEASFVLVDSVRKKTDFLNQLVNDLNLKKITIENVRAENLRNKYSKQFDIITARAVAPLIELFQFSKPLIKPNGEMMFFKGKNFHDELNQLYDMKERTEQKIIFLSDIPFVSESQNGIIIKIKLCLP